MVLQARRLGTSGSLHCLQAAPSSDAQRWAEVDRRSGEPRLHERRQKELLNFWTEGIEEQDPLAKEIFQQNTAAAGDFVRDKPELSKPGAWFSRLGD